MLSVDHVSLGTPCNVRGVIDAQLSDALRLQKPLLALCTAELMMHACSRVSDAMTPSLLPADMKNMI